MLRRMTLHKPPTRSAVRRSSTLLALGALLFAVACTPQDPGADGPADRATVAQPLATAATVTAADAIDRQPIEQAEGDDITPDPTAAPVPTTCYAERTCGARKYVCKRPDEPRPCGAPGCSEMQFACSADAACLEGYRCALCKPGDGYPCPFIGGMCRPAACATDSDCKSPNLVCQAGRCAHKPCRRSATCRGYCVSGACWDKGGWCHDTSLPPPP